jgi:hypothetical protein
VSDVAQCAGWRLELFWIWTGELCVGAELHGALASVWGAGAGAGTVLCAIWTRVQVQS